MRSGLPGMSQLWTTLRDPAGLTSRLPGVDFDHLIDRAEWQHAELEAFRVRTGTDAFGEDGSG